MQIANKDATDAFHFNFFADGFDSLAVCFQSLAVAANDLRNSVKFSTLTVRVFIADRDMESLKLIDVT
jgi:hypothetical protein